MVCGRGKVAIHMKLSDQIVRPMMTHFMTLYPIVLKHIKHLAYFVTSNSSCFFSGLGTRECYQP